MHRMTRIVALATTAALLAGCAGPPAEESTHTQPPAENYPPITSGDPCVQPYDGVESDERVAGDPIGDVATREGGPATGDGNDAVPPACGEPAAVTGATPQG